MRLSRVEIRNFRNFKSLDLLLGDNAVILGENKVGKTNLLFALRILLDPTLPETYRKLKLEDFWDGLRPLTKEHEISISIEFQDFDTNMNILSILGDCLVSTSPMIARISYVFRPKQNLVDNPKSEEDYEYVILGGDRQLTSIAYEIRHWMPLDFFPALRDAESDLARWHRSPLRPLLDRASKKTDPEKLKAISDDMKTATDKVTQLKELTDLMKVVNSQINSMVGEKHSIATALGFASTEPDRLFRQLQMLIDGGIRGVSEASLGSANILYLALKQLEHSNLLKNEERQHTILAIEEPEAHIHPHLQRLIYRTYLRTRSDAERKQDQCSIFLTTHSPNIASVAPLANIVLLHKDHKQNFTTGRSLSKLTLEVMESDDLERYIDVTRGEIFFSKGVILVEGDAEKFLISTLADLLDDPINLDAVGISVCSIGGTNFSPFIKLLGPKGLDIPFVVLTDLDPKEKDGSQEDEDMGSSTLDSYGKQRVVNQIMKHLLSPEEFGRGAEFALALAPEKGIFLNTFTFEIDLINTGIHNIFRDVAKELTTNKQIHRRFEGLIEKPESLVAKSLLKDIESIGKGRFAQRLSSHLHKSKTNACPPYIKMALEHLRKALT